MPAFRHLSMFAGIVFGTMPHPTRCGLENSATYAPSGRALALV